jgi:hypothetical protein
LSHEVSYEHESQSGDSEESKSGSDTTTRLNVAGAIALAGVTYDFGLLTMTKTRLTSLRSNGHYFPKGCGRPHGAESMPEPRPDEAVMFEDFFTAGFACPHTHFF